MHQSDGIKNISVVISAPSGAGKSTIIDALLMDDERFEFSVSTTTRARRGSEVEGENYNYITEERFRKMIENNEFLEWALVHQNYYGTTKKEIDRIQATGRIPIFDVDIQGTMQLKKNLKSGVFIFIVPPSFSELEKRLTQRNTDSPEQISIRLENARQELKKYDLYDYLVVNDILDSAVGKIKSIVTAELCKKNTLKDYMESILEEQP